MSTFFLIKSSYIVDTIDKSPKQKSEYNIDICYMGLRIDYADWMRANLIFKTITKSEMN